MDEQMTMTGAKPKSRPEKSGEAAATSARPKKSRKPRVSQLKATQGRERTTPHRAPEPRGPSSAGRVPTSASATPRRARAATPQAKEAKGAAAAGRPPRPMRGPSPAERVPAPTPGAPRRRPTRPYKAAAPAKERRTQAEPDAEAPAGPPPFARSEALKILVDRANAGNRNCLHGLRAILDQSPEIWREVGDLTKHAELAWTDLVGGEDNLVLEAVKRHLARMKDQLAGPEPTPVEQLLVEQVALSWLASRHAEMASAQPGSSSLGEGKMRLKRAESAQRRHLAALKMLTELRAHSERKR